MLADPGLIETLLTAPTDTVSAALPLFPPTAAVIVALPDAPATTMPPDDTAPIDGSELDHAIVCPVIVFPDPSFTVAESCSLSPEMRLTTLGETETLLMAPAETMSAAEPLAPVVLAVIVVVPACDAVTTPPDDTVPTEVFELDQLTGSPVSTFPEASLMVVESCWVLPAASPTDPGVMASVLAAPALTVIDAVALFPSAVPVMVEVPT